MKKIFFSLIMLLAFTTASWAHGGQGMMGSGQGGMMGQGYGGMGMMGQGHGGMGMMGKGQGYGGMGMMGKGQGYGGMGMMGRGQGQCEGNISPQQKAEVKKFLDETKELRKSLLLKRFEYSEATRDDKTTMEDLETLRGEIFELKSKIHERSPWDKG